MHQTMPMAQKNTAWDWSEDTAAEQGKSDLLNHLRFVALGCRAKARADLFHACALLSMDRSSSIRAHAEALMRCLDSALDRRAVMFRPGTMEHSFDEAWLLQLAAALRRDDEDSTRFLLHSRVAREHQRHVQFLVSRISEQFL